MYLSLRISIRKRDFLDISSIIIDILSTFSDHSGAPLTSPQIIANLVAWYPAKCSNTTSIPGKLTIGSMQGCRDDYDECGDADDFDDIDDDDNNNNDDVWW